MMPYSIVIENSAKKFLKKLPTLERIRIIEAIDQLSEDPRPHGVKKLTGHEAWRIRVGSFRVIYEVEDAVLKVIIIRIGYPL